MATIRLALFNSRSAWQPDKQVMPITWEGFSDTVHPTMKRNDSSGIVYRLEFDRPLANANYGVLVFVEDIARKQMCMGIIDQKHTDYVQVSGGHVNGMKRNLVYTVVVIS